jgi:Zn-dependent peptidase ImmA (M78 family)/DNA-binding XRE family transcriptional regulator
MPARVEALVKRELLVWARESAGLSREAAAKKVPVKTEKLAEWETGAARPTIPQLRKLANAYKRPLAVFYLPAPPRGFDAMHDFRRLPGEVAGTQSPELRRAIRQVRVRRQMALDLYKELEADPATFELTATLNDDPESVGERVRDFLGVNYENQIRWRNEYEGFKIWRASLEARGVAVFQVEDVSTDEMRGFSISEASLPAVILNISDPVRPRIFTMLHEAVHLALRDGGLCDLDEEQRRPPEELRAEVFSNHAAGAALMPRANLLAEPEVARQVRPTDWPDRVIDALASRYCVSREALVRRLVIVGRTTNAFYLRKRSQYQREYRALAAERARIVAARRAAGEKVGGGAPPHTLAVSTAGPLFTRLVLDGYEREIITASDVSDYLEIRLKHLPKVERAMLGAEP